MHQRHLNLTVAGEVERLGRSVAFGKGLGPNAQEVYGVGQNQPGAGVDDARGQKILDFVPGFLRHPVVDVLRGRSRLGAEVNLVDAGLVLLRGSLQKRGQERKAFLGPERIGDVQLNGVRFLVRFELGLEFSEEGGELLLIGAKPHDVGHLRLRLAARARVGHRQAGRDAVGEEEKVALVGRELSVEVQGKGRIAGNEGLQLSRHNHWPQEKNAPQQNQQAWFYGASPVAVFEWSQHQIKKEQIFVFHNHS